MELDSIVNKIMTSTARVSQQQQQQQQQQRLCCLGWGSGAATRKTISATSAVFSTPYIGGRRCGSRIVVLRACRTYVPLLCNSETPPDPAALGASCLVWRMLYVAICFRQRLFPSYHSAREYSPVYLVRRCISHPHMGRSGCLRRFWLG